MNGIFVYLDMDTNFRRAQVGRICEMCGCLWGAWLRSLGSGFSDRMGKRLGKPDTAARTRPAQDTRAAGVYGRNEDPKQPKGAKLREGAQRARSSEGECNGPEDSNRA
jgi:hypothetical protein